MTAAILSIGTELTRGEIINTNASWLAERLTTLGIDVTAMEVVDDDRARIGAVLARLGAAHDLIVSTGGLGPTTDDITSECVASFLGVALERDAASLEAIRSRMERFGRAMAESNAKQADFPRGATVLPNAHGTAPGFSVLVGKALAFFMPGVPAEMRPMFDEFVAPRAAEKKLGSMFQVRVRTFGLAESTVNDRLAGIEAEHGVIIGYRAHFPEIEVKVLARAKTDEDAARIARRAADEVRARLGEAAYGEGEAALPEVVGTMLKDHGLSFATAESCTGGLVAELVTDVAGSSAYFRGSIVSYADDIKTKQLDVKAELIASHGAVSAEVARAMAEGVRASLGVDVALSLTGIAGPGGGTPEKPVGLVHFAVATAEGTTARRILFPSTRAHVRKLSAFAGLALVRKVLLEGHD